MGKIEKVKNNLTLEFEDDVELMKRQIAELKKLRLIIRTSGEYQSLDGKTQMIGTYIENEYIKGAQSRGEHTEKVAKIAKKTVSLIYDKFGSEEEKQTEVYQLNKEVAELYSEIMGYSHDLGHTPFGHVGEAGLNVFFRNIEDKAEIDRILENRMQVFGKKYEELQLHTPDNIRYLYMHGLSFSHNEQSARIFYDIVKREKINGDLIDFDRIIWGILVHSTSRVKSEYLPNDIVIQSIRAADKIEYVNSDFQELSSSLKPIDNPNLKDYAQLDYNKRVSKVISDISYEVFQRGKIDENMKAFRALDRLKKINNECVMSVDVDGKRGLVKNENVERLKLITKKIAEYYYNHDNAVIQNDVNWPMKPINYNKSASAVLGYQSLGALPETKAEKVIKYVSSMDNERCENVYRKLVIDRILYGKGHGIEPITEDEIEKIKSEQLQEALNKKISRFKKDEINDDDPGYSIGEEIGQEKKLKERAMKEISDYKANKLSEYGRQEMETNRRKHKNENLRDQRYRLLMNTIDSNYRGKLSIDEIRKIVEVKIIDIENEFRESEEKNIVVRGDTRIRQYDPKIAQIISGQNGEKKKNEEDYEK